ncbi:MAG: DMT family transporter [Candidatus Odinarchaeota archaeon]
MSFRYHAQTYLVAATLIWGLAPIFLETVLDYLTPLRAITLRFSIAVLILFLLVFFTRGIKGFSLLSNKTCILLGWIDAFGYLAATLGQEMTTVGLATLISTCYLVIVPFYAWKLEGNKPSVMIVGLAFIAMIGVFLIGFDGDWSTFSFSSLSILGILILVIAALLFGLYVAVSGKFLKESNSNGKNIDPLAYLNATTFWVFFPLLLLSIFTDNSPFYLPLQVVPAILFIAIFATIIAFGLYNWAIERLGSVRTSFYLLLQVVIPFTFELVIWRQYYSYWVYGGISIILIVLLLISTGGRNLKHDIKNIRLMLAKLRAPSLDHSFKMNFESELKNRTQ